MSTVKEIQQISNAILQTLFSAQVGAKPLTPALFHQPLNSYEYHKVIQRRQDQRRESLDQERELVHEIQLDYLSQADAPTRSTTHKRVPYETDEEEALLQRIDILKKELAEHVAVQLVERSIVTNLSLSQHLVDAVGKGSDADRNHHQRTLVRLAQRRAYLT
ncbi:hypothetical protein IWQ61_010643, partial [Dispira simplex]